MKQITSLSVIAAVTGLFLSLSVNAQNTFPSSGSVGIGTTTPSSLFHVYGSSPFQEFSFNNTGYLTNVTVTTAKIRNIARQWNSGYSATNLNETSLIKFDYFADVNGQIRKAAIRFLTQDDGSGSTQERMSIVAGNIGINNPAPSAKLQVTNGSVLFDGTTGGATPISGAGARMMWILAKSAFRAGIVTGSTWDDANIGASSFATGQDTKASGVWSSAIGAFTTASGTGSFAAGSTTTAQSLFSFVVGTYNYAPGTYDPLYWIATDPIFVIGNGNSPSSRSNAVTVLKNGKVLIGDPATVTMPDGYKLFVQTGILTEKVKIALKTTTDWSDYVFAKNYKLKPLEELESYIQANKHLPNIPSADEMVKDGLDVAAMDAKLLAKIEELTIYVIDLNKQNAELKKGMESLNKEIKTLKKK